MKDLNKAMDILRQISTLELDETPVVTWDEHLEAQGKKLKSGHREGMLAGAAFVLIALLILDILTGHKVFVQ